MKVYFARSLRGFGKPVSPAVQQFYKSIVLHIEQSHQSQFPLVHGVNKKLFGEDQWDSFIYTRDLAWIDLCERMIAEVTYPSHGVGYEVCYAALVRKIPVLCVAEKDCTVSAMITGGLKVLYYRSFEDLTGMIDAFLASSLEELKDLSFV